MFAMIMRIMINGFHRVNVISFQFLKSSFFLQIIYFFLILKTGIGSLKWVHQNCIQMWVDTQLKNSQNNKVSCPQCKTQVDIFFI